MGKLLLILSVIGGISFLAWKSCLNCHSPSPPHLDLDEWWGPDAAKGKPDNSIRPFKIEFSTEMIKDLKDRLARTKLTPGFKDVGFSFGTHSTAVAKAIDYWQNKYDFKSREKFLNQFPQFKTKIQGLDIHFLRIKPQVSKDTKVLPILLLHGWPGSVREYYEMVTILTQKKAGYDFVFEVIVPSLPGYGFSDGASRPGLATAKIAVIMKNLMQRLGFKKYYVHGGDWGALVTSAMATVYPEEILGYHTNMASAFSLCNTVKTLLGAFAPSLVADADVVDRMYPLSDWISRLLEETGYYHIQSTKPDTVGVALNDSPAGLAAYILEKFSTWTDHKFKPLEDGGLTQKFSYDQLLDNVMLYWISNSITTSMRLYAEEASKGAVNVGSIPTEVPTWVIQAKYELMYQPPSMLRVKYKNLLNTTVIQDGGHFLAFELPKIVAEDIFKATKAFTKFYAEKSGEKTEL